MSETYAAETVDDVVVRVIVGDAVWASVALGGVWRDTNNLVGVGWTWDGHEFVPPVPSDILDGEVDG